MNRTRTNSPSYTTDAERTRNGRRLGLALGRAWVAYQRRLDAEVRAAGFADRTFPDGRVLRMCRDDEGVTISHIGRELGITRQGAAKIVGRLRDRGYVAVAPSPNSRREKAVTITPIALEYLTAQRRAAHRVERELHAQLGEDGLASLYRLLDVLEADEHTRLREYLADQ